MKKLLISLLSFIALTSLAKTGDELIAEYWSKASSTYDYKVAAAIAKDNTADVVAAIKVWSVGDPAKFDAEDKRSEQSKKDVQAARLISSAYLNSGIDKYPEIKALPLHYACEVISTKVLAAYEVDNPTLYTELKANDFKIDGVKLSFTAVCNLAVAAGDIDYAFNLPLKEVIHNNNWQRILKVKLLSMPVAEAKAKVIEIENWYILRDKEIPTSIKSISKVLTSRMVDAKLQGK